jgi:galactokinase
MTTWNVFAPGRAEVLGNHTDYNDGLVLSMAIEPGTRIRATSRDDKELHLRSDGQSEGWKGHLDQLEPLRDPQPTWPNYVIGVASELLQRGHQFPGLDMEISSNIPIGAGLSSSASLEMAAGLAFKTAGNFELNEFDLARAGQSAEHAFAGANCGLLDQISVLMSQAGKITFIDCRSLEVRHLPFPEGWQFVLVHSGATHELNDGGYNQRREACEVAARKLGLPSLRDISPGELEARRGDLEPMEFKRDAHPVGETARVAQAVSCLAGGKVEEFGNLMFESHRSSIDNFENSCAELDFLVEQARQHPACVGARLSGGGFGGATINLVRSGEVRHFSEAIVSAYQEEYGRQPLIMSSPPSGGARVEN